MAWTVYSIEALWGMPLETFESREDAEREARRR